MFAHKSTEVNSEKRLEIKGFPRLLELKIRLRNLSEKDQPNSIYREYTCAEIELAVGNYLISKGVPIIDYYSHMGGKVTNK